MLAHAVTLAILSGVDGGHEVLTLLDRQSAAWTRGDLDTFCSVYADDAVFVSLSPIDVRAGSDEVSVAAKWTLSYPDKPDATGHTVVVFRRQASGWFIVHDASM
jgi:ketosteroid isomerase-like protein